jgi:hypothetical protein
MPGSTQDRLSSILTVLLAALAVLLLFLSGCATTTTTEPEEIPGPPDWVLTPPQADGLHEYFVGHAADAGGDIVKAEDQAVYSLLGEITRYLGVTVTTESTAEARATLDDFEAAVTETVKQTGTARVSGFRIIDRYIDEREDRVTIYILGQYEKKALEAEKSRITEQFKEKIEAISGPEDDAKKLELLGDYFGALTKYIEAAVAATSSDIENADIKFERNINNAKNVVSQINVFGLNDNLQGVIGEPFEEDFRLKVVQGTDPDGFGLEGVNIRVSYKELRSNGRMGIKSINIQTDAEGFISFTHPVPNFVGSENIVMALDLSAYLEPLEDVDPGFYKYIESLEDLLDEKRVTFRYTIISMAKEIPTGIVVLDVDMGRNPTGNNLTASGILEALGEANFTVKSLPYDTSLLQNMSDAEIIQILAANFDSQVRRVVFGIIALEEFDETDGDYLVKVSGTVKAADLKNNNILYTKNLFSRSRGSSSESAISAAYKNLGKKFGSDLARNLP